MNSTPDTASSVPVRPGDAGTPTPQTTAPDAASPRPGDASRTTLADLRRTVVTAADGARLAVFVGEPANLPQGAPTVVMSHGWTLSHRSWEPVAQRLLAGGEVRVVMWDQRGHGDSTFARGGRRPGNETVRALGDDLAAVIDAAAPADSPVVLAGHSMGGMTVMAFAGLHPELLRSRVVGAVLVSTSSGRLRGFSVPGEKWIVKVLEHVPFSPGRLITMGSQRRGGFGAHPREEDVRAARDQIAATRISTSGAFFTALMAHDELAALAQLGTIDVRILVGSRDKLTPKRHSIALAEAMPNATLEVLPDRGHMLPYEEPDAVCAAIRSVLPDEASRPAPQRV